MILVTWAWVPVSSPSSLVTVERRGASSECLPCITLQYPVTLIPNPVFPRQDPPFNRSPGVTVPFDPDTIFIICIKHDVHSE